MIKELFNLSNLSKEHILRVQGWWKESRPLRQQPPYAHINDLHGSANKQVYNYHIVQYIQYDTSVTFLGL